MGFFFQQLMYITKKEKATTNRNVLSALEMRMKVRTDETTNCRFGCTLCFILGLALTLLRCIYLVSDDIISHSLIVFKIKYNRKERVWSWWDTPCFILGKC